MAVLQPLKVVIRNHDGDEVVQCQNMPGDKSQGAHSAVFSSEIWIEATDFQEVKPFKSILISLQNTHLAALSYAAATIALWLSTESKKFTGQTCQKVD